MSPWVSVTGVMSVRSLAPLEKANCRGMVAELRMGALVERQNRRFQNDNWERFTQHLGSKRIQFCMVLSWKLDTTIVPHIKTYRSSFCCNPHINDMKCTLKKIHTFSILTFHCYIKTLLISFQLSVDLQTSMFGRCSTKSLVPAFNLPAKPL